MIKSNMCSRQFISNCSAFYVHLNFGIGIFLTQSREKRKPEREARNVKDLISKAISALVSQVAGLVTILI